LYPCLHFIDLEYINLKTAVGGGVEANSFARTTCYVRMNSHLQEQLNALKFPINRKVILQQLMLLGRTADIANNGHEALAPTR
jgi:hypothetical protein